MSRHNIHDPIETVNEDILNRKLLAKQILKHLKEPQCPPAIGIYGGWGTGKSSLLNLICLENSQADSDIDIHIIDAWKYDGTENLLTPVVMLLKKLSKKNALKDLSYWGTSALQVLRVTSLATVDVLASKYLGASIDDIKKISEEEFSNSIINKWETLTDDIKGVADAFQKLANSALKQENHKLVLCIDNLDRCTPNHVVNLLESIKNFVGVQNCIWVFAIDSSVIASYINHKYDGTAMDGNSYLDKMISEQYHLSLSPSQNGNEIIRLIQHATNERFTLENIEQLPQVPKALTPRRLIKSAKKLSNTPNDAGEPEHLLFAMILLYHTWPEFYERLSSPNREHIAGILAHFFKDKTKEKWDDFHPISLNKKFTNDPELIYFLRHVFPHYTTNASEILRIIKNICNALRDVGLP